METPAGPSKSPSSLLDAAAVRDDPDKRSHQDQSTGYLDHYASPRYPFAGLIRDVLIRVPYYKSDWLDGFNVRTLLACLRIFFLNVFPALAYTQDMYDRTGGNYGVNEALLATALGGVVFGALSCQPLTIVGITGLINLFNYTTYDIIIGIWAAILHWIIAIFNLTALCRYVTAFTAETFGMYVCVVYIQKGIELIVSEFDHDTRAGFMSTVISFGFFFTYWALVHLGTSSYLHPRIRGIASDFGMFASVVFWTGFCYIPGNLRDTQFQRLVITKSFEPTIDRGWIVSLNEVSTSYRFAALPFGALVTALFYFDHNVSSIAAQAKHYPLKKPAGFHWDFFLLGITTLVAGLLGIPYPNALVPQAPMHTDSCCVWETVPVDYIDKNVTSATVTPIEQDMGDDDAAGNIKLASTEWDEYRLRRRKSTVERGTLPLNREQTLMEMLKPKKRTIITSVVEQRISNTGQGLLALGCMAGPLLVIGHLIPRAVLAGVFLAVGYVGIEGNRLTQLTLYLFRDPLQPPHPTSLQAQLMLVPTRQVVLFVAIAWTGFALTYAISQTIAGIGFPVLILLLIPLRATWMQAWFKQEELDVLDTPVASGLALNSIGGLPSCVAPGGKGDAL
ncbi:hypothetical protein FRB96_005335 [Tulasnella sp. 330]|nr:hypothetical protein FRB96_005335 [Tulasnella sp. 330]KAG8876066.1 hypothetical protein FRB98_007470 [Tulasnella sp. 332]